MAIWVLTMNPSSIKSDLERRGFLLSMRGKTLLVSPGKLLTPADADLIRAHRDGLIAEVMKAAGKAEESEGETWDSGTADGIVAVVHCRLSGLDMTATIGRLCDAVDAAWVAQDLSALNKAAGAVIRHVDGQQERKIGKAIQFERTPEGLLLWAGWVRLPGRKWVCVASDVIDRGNLDEFMHDFSRIRNLKTEVLPAGVKPINRKKE